MVGKANYLSGIFEHPMLALFVTLVLGALALSGRFSVTATRILLFAAFCVAVVGLGGVPYLMVKSWRLVLSIIATAAALFILGAWAKPDAVPVSVGILTPKRHLLFSFANEKAETPIIEIDSTNVKLAWTGEKGKPIFGTLQGSLLAIESVRGQIKVSAQIRDKSGNLVAELNRNEWKIGSNAWDRNYTSDALEVIDASGDVAIQVKVLPDCIQLQGEWWDKYGTGIRIVADPRVTKIDGGPSAVIMPLSKTFDPSEPKIERIFEYPSETHLGELRRR